MKPSEMRFYQHSPIEDATFDVVYRRKELQTPQELWSEGPPLNTSIKKKRTLDLF
jgi:hypothetical protein